MFAPENLAYLARRVRQSHPASTRFHSTHYNKAVYGAYSRDYSRLPRRRSYTPSTAIGSVPNLSGHKKYCVPMTLTAERPPEQATEPLGLLEVLKAVIVMGAVFSCIRITMDQLMCASLIFPHLV